MAKNRKDVEKDRLVERVIMEGEQEIRKEMLKELEIELHENKMSIVMASIYDSPEQAELVKAAQANLNKTLDLIKRVKGKQ